MCEDNSNYCTYPFYFKKRCPSIVIFFLFVFISSLNPIQQVFAEDVTLIAQQENCHEHPNGEYPVHIARNNTIGFYTT